MRTFLAMVTALVLTTSVFAFVPVAYAEDASALERLQRVGDAADLTAPQQERQLASIIGQIIAAASSLLGVIFVAQMVYAGWLWMTARDEMDQLEKAKHIIQRSIIGLVIVLGAWAITTFVIARIELAVA